MMMTSLEKSINTKQKVQAAVETLIQAIDDGEADPLQTMIELKGLEDFCKKAKEAIRDAAINELYKYGKTATIHGSVLRVNTGRRTFSYDHYDKWLVKKHELEMIEKEMKAAMNHTVIDESTGEVIPPAKVKYSTESISVELP